jgi:ribosomal protein S18 acetylase RimI-like enzyme
VTPQSFLEADELRHITPLKIRLLFGELVQWQWVELGDERGLLFWMPRANSQWDTGKYPLAQHVIYPAFVASASAGLSDIAARQIVELTRGESFVVKTIDDGIVAALRSAAGAVRPMRFERALITFCASRAVATTAAGESPNDADELHCFASIPDSARALLDEHDVYSANDLATMFSAGDARCWTISRANVAVAIALSFPNAPRLHEIGSLYVHPSARRAGHGKRLVRATLADLSARGLSVRYVVDAQNAASIALAERSGLREVMRLAHWFVQ